jgi:hypothetical protein
MPLPFLLHVLTSSGNHLTIQRTQITTAENAEDTQYGHSFICRTCPYEFVVNKEYYNRRWSKVKQVDDVMGGAAAWQNVDQTTGILGSGVDAIFTVDSCFSCG